MRHKRLHFEGKPLHWDQLELYEFIRVKDACMFLMEETWTTWESEHILAQQRERLWRVGIQETKD